MKVVVNSIPKSGTHLLVRLFELLGFNESKLHLSGSLVRYSRNPLHSLRVAARKGEGFSVDLDDIHNQIKVDKLKSLVKSKVRECEFAEAHLPYSKSLADYLCQSTNFLYITRDPRAIVASHIAHVFKVKGYPLRPVFDVCDDNEKVNIILNGYQKGNYKLLPLKQRISNSLEWIRCSNVCHTTFESLIGPKGGGDESLQYSEVKRIMEFVDYQGSKKTSEVAENLFYSKSETFNKGAVDGWKTALSASQIDQVNKELSNVISAMGYS
jgi:hypothetical protein